VIRQLWDFAGTKIALSPSERGIPENYKTTINISKHFFPSYPPISETALFVLEGPLSAPVCPFVEKNFGEKDEY